MKPMISFGALAAALVVATPSIAAPVIVNANADLLASPVSFVVQGVSFTLSAVADPYAPLLVSNGTGGAISSFFGSPSSTFIDRNTVTFGPDEFGAYTSFDSPTSVYPSNGNNLLGFRATIGSDNYYGFAFTTDNILNSYGFETVANTAITATAAVPEPAIWAMMLIGFGMTSVSMRYRRRSTKIAYA